MTDSITVYAPAKVNLSLHVTGRRPDGYHLLESLTCFANVYDRITVNSEDDIALTVTGPEAADVPAGKENLAVQAAQFAASCLNIGTGAHITLDKRIPVSAGLGGGSADAAAVLKACARLWNMSLDRVIDNSALANALGADVPVCYLGRAARVTGIGEAVEAVPAWPDVWLVLVNPRISLSTAQVFTTFAGPIIEPQPNTLLAEGWGASANDFADRLRQWSNSLTDTAQSLAPVIREVLTALETAQNCLLARMSGSGPTCFGLFATEAEAQAAVAKLLTAEPKWWVKPARLLAETR